MKRQRGIAAECRASRAARPLRRRKRELCYDWPWLEFQSHAVGGKAPRGIERHDTPGKALGISGSMARTIMNNSFGGGVLRRRESGVKRLIHPCIRP